jgi:DNA-binding NtrC family response regulator
MEKVLLVDDNDSVRRIARAFMESAGYEVIEAANATDAVVCARKHGPIGVLVTDIPMPDVDGIELVAWLSPLCPSLRVLYTSGYDRTSIGQTDAGFLQKPYSCEELVDAVNALMATGEPADLDDDLARRPARSPQAASRQALE